MLGIIKQVFCGKEKFKLSLKKKRLTKKLGVETVT